MIYKLIHSWFNKHRIKSIDTKREEKTIYLTFDDGPEPIITEFVLGLLEKYNAKGSFFCCGNNIIKNRKLYDAITKDGHFVGSHTMSHLRGDKTPPLRYIYETLIFRLKYGTSVIRPPYGSLTRLQMFLLIVLRFKIILWSVDSMDWFEAPLEQIDVLRIADKVKPGDILLFHFSEEHRLRTEYILPQVLEILSKRGFTFSSIPSSI